MSAGGKYDGLPELFPDEPYFILRGRDVLAPWAVEAYAALLRAAAAGANRPAPAGATVEETRTHFERRDELHAMAVDAHQRAAQMLAYQVERGSKLPD